MFNEGILTISDVASFLKIPKSSVYKLIHDGGLPAHKVGKHFRLVQDEVKEWLYQGGLSVPKV
ncbi:MAG: helix-turn-helix domain-containing protein [Nitrospirales bacterium]